MARPARPAARAASGPPMVPAWMLTYADAMSLLLTFFVMLLTFSTLSDEDFDKAAGGLRGAMGDLLPASLDARSSVDPERIGYSSRVTTYGIETPPELGPMPWTQLPLDARLKRRLSGTPVTLASSRKGLLLRLPSDDLFGPAGTELTEQGARLIDHVVSVIRHLPNDIEIAAHTDATSPGGPGSEADIGLSAEQGIAVARRLGAYAPSLIEGGAIAPERLGVSAPGGTVPLFKGSSPVALAINRRVEITLLRCSR